MPEPTDIHAAAPLAVKFVPVRCLGDFTLHRTGIEYFTGYSGGTVLSTRSSISQFVGLPSSSACNSSRLAAQAEMSCTSQPTMLTGVACLDTGLYTKTKVFCTYSSGRSMLLVTLQDDTTPNERRYTLPPVSTLSGAESSNDLDGKKIPRPAHYI